MRKGQADSHFPKNGNKQAKRVSKLYSNREKGRQSLLNRTSDQIDLSQQSNIEFCIVDSVILPLPFPPQS